jgi:hypothetical protein
MATGSTGGLNISTPAEILGWLNNWLPALRDHLAPGAPGTKEVNAGLPTLMLQELQKRLAALHAVALFSVQDDKLRIQASMFPSSGEPRYLVLFHSIKGLRPLFVLPDNMTNQQQLQHRMFMAQWIDSAENDVPAWLSMGAGSVT